MMCTNCGKTWKLDDQEQFCPYCGKSLRTKNMVKECPVCGKTNSSKPLCNECGFDCTTNAERYHTFSLLNSHPKSIRGLQEEYFISLHHHPYSRNGLVAAADHGDAESQYKLGEQYRLGINTKQDMLSALKWYQQAANQGHSEAQYQIGMHYLNIPNGEKYRSKGIEWIKIAADNGCANAKNILAGLL